MIELYLDNIQLEVPQDIGIGLSLGIADYADPVTASGAYTQTIDIPRTPNNDRAFNLAGEILSAEQFNNAEHTARVLQDGCELVGGKAYLEGATLQSYRLQIVGAEVGWVANVKDKKLSELEGDVIGWFGPTDWGEVDRDDPEGLPSLSFVLMDHGCWWQETEEDNTRRSWVTYSDLIPMVKLHTLLAHIFRGYDIEVSDRLRKLLHVTYCTMRWKTDEKASIKAEDYGFELTSRLLNANSDGELAINLNDTFEMPLFDTIVEDKSGRLAVEGGVDSTIVRFDPEQDITASLELKTQYQTTISTHLEPFTDNNETWTEVELYGHTFADQLYQYGDDRPFVQFDLTDSLEWANREMLDEGSNFKAIEKFNANKSIPISDLPLCYVTVAYPERYQSIGYVILEKKGDSYTKKYVPTKATVEKSQMVLTNMISSRSSFEASFIMHPALRGKNGELYVYKRPKGLLEFYGDKTANDVYVWGLSADQRLTFDVALKMPAKKYLQGDLYDISLLRFECSRNDRDITVYGSAEGSLKANFEYGVPIYEGVKLSDIGGDTTADDMLRSIMQMYNLLIYTNPYTKKVHLYTFDEYWNRGSVVNWSDRIDSDNEISVVPIVDNISKEVILSYADGNPRVEYYNARNTLPYFAYKTTLPTKMTKETKEVQNALFSPAFMVKVSEAFGGGSGIIPALAGKDAKNTVLDFNLGDVPMTAMLVDMQIAAPKLPLNTDVFGDIGPMQPPIVATIDGETTLSFADREGTRGLHRFYDRQIELWRKGKRLICYCRIDAWEIEALRMNDYNLNFSSIFKLNINGEDIYARLESVEYEPTNTTNKCTFIIE